MVVGVVGVEVVWWWLWWWVVVVVVGVVVVAVVVVVGGGWWQWWWWVVEVAGWGCGGEGGIPDKISRGTPLEVQNGTQHDLNKMIDLGQIWGAKRSFGEKDCLDAENGGRSK